MAAKKTKKKTNKNSDVVHTVDSLTNAVRDISNTRKIELQDDPEVAKAICDLADYLGEQFFKILDEAVQNESDADKKKNMVLVLQLAYLKMSSQLLDMEGKIDLTSEIPTSGYIGCNPINMKDNPPIYY